MLSLDPAEPTLPSFPNPGEASVAPWSPGKEDGLREATLPAQHPSAILSLLFAVPSPGPEANGPQWFG